MRFAGALSILALGAGATAFAQDASNATDKDQVIRDLQLKLGAMETRLGALEANGTAPGTSSSGSRVDEAVRHSPPEALREPRRLNISAPGLEGLDISGGLHMRADYWANFDDSGHVAPNQGGNNDVFSLGTEAWLEFDARISEKTRVGIKAHYADVWGGDTSHGLGGGGTGTPGFDDGNSLSLAEAYLSVLDLYQTGIDFTGGRQRIEFGAERMIGDDEWRLNRTSFDGVRLDQNMGEDAGRWSFIALRLEDNDNFGDSELMPTSFNKDDNASLFGLYYTTMCPSIGDIDLYLFHLEDFNHPGGAGRTRFTTYGARWAGLDWSGFHLDAEAATQFGELNGEKTHDWGFDTWAAHLGAGYKVEGLEFINGVHAGYDYASGGDKSPENFVQLFPTLHGWFGVTDFFSWTNIQHWNLGVDVAVCEGELRVDYHWARRASNDSGFQGYNISSYSDAAGGSKNLGQEIDAVYTVDCTKSTKVGIGGGWFFPGEGYHDITGASNNILYSYIMLRTAF